MQLKRNMQSISLSWVTEFQKRIFQPSSLLKQQTIANCPYSIVYYEKDLLPVELIPTYGIFRSIILKDSHTNEVVCFSPPKCIPSETFMREYPISSGSGSGSGIHTSLVAEEFVEGTMINVFWDVEWKIATKKTIGAESVFFKKNNGKNKHFRQMFFEALDFCGLPSLDVLDKDICYSFVMQHPENRIVVPFLKPALYLVAAYKIYNVHDSDDSDDAAEYLSEVVVQPQSRCEVLKTIANKTSHAMTMTIQTPKQYSSWTNYSELIDQFASANTPYHIMGVVVRHSETGQRMKFRNPTYEEVRRLRGNHPKLQYQYLCLRREGAVSAFLAWYPEYRKECSAFRDQIHFFTSALHANYVSCFIRKEKPLHFFSNQFLPHLKALHKMYLTELREQNTGMHHSNVVDYVNQLHPTFLMYSLNFSLRKRESAAAAAAAPIDI